MGKCNWRKGFTRLALVWCGFWFVFGLLFWWIQQANEPKYLQWMREQDWTLVKMAGDNIAMAMRMQMLALIMGVLVPLLALMFGTLGWWVFRGFIPRDHEA